MKVTFAFLAIALLASQAIAQTPTDTPSSTLPTPGTPVSTTPSATTTPSSTTPSAVTPTPTSTAGPPRAPPPVVAPTPRAAPPTTPVGTTPAATPTRTPAGPTPTGTPARTPSGSTTPATPSSGGGGSSSGGSSSSSSSGTTTPSAAATTNGQAPTDADILTFAYNLEIFEAQFYSCASSGSPIPSQYLGGGPGPNVCQKANLSSNVATYAAELAREELAHVALLYTALKAAGANPVAPQLDISATPFNNAAKVALNNQNPNPTFDPYANDYFFLHGVFLFEDLGCSAYLGALNSISNSSYRLTAAQIAATEAYHASLDRTLLYQVLNVTPAYGLTVAQITDGIVSAINTLAGQPQIKYAIYNQQGSSISNVDSNALVPAASAQQVLRVVTLGAPSGTGGGFFPNNLSGNVKN